MSWMEKFYLNNWAICFSNLPLRYQRNYFKVFYQIEAVSNIFYFSFLVGYVPMVNGRSE